MDTTLLFPTLRTLTIFTGTVYTCISVAILVITGRGGGVERRRGQQCVCSSQAVVPPRPTAEALNFFLMRSEFVSAPSLSRREVAELAGTTLSAVNKAIEQKVVRARRRGGRALLSPEDVAALALLSDVRVTLPVTVKRRVAEWGRSCPRKGATLRLDGALVVRADGEVAAAANAARRYVSLRDRLVESDREVRGGEPVIRGTRVSVRALARQLELGETREVLREDYPFLPEEAFELAPLWARSHPPQGRPSRPWAQSGRAIGKSAVRAA
jgi:uncharacterized protein (DUF433 family)